jgi:hypothetical protein
MAVSRILRQILRLFRWGFQFVLHVPNRSCKGWCGNDVSHGHRYLKFGFSMIIICPWLVKVPSHGHEQVLPVLKIIICYLFLDWCFLTINLILVQNQ